MLDGSRRGTRQMGLRRLFALTRANSWRNIDQRLCSHGLTNLVPVLSHSGDQWEQQLLNRSFISARLAVRSQTGQKSVYKKIDILKIFTLNLDNFYCLHVVQIFPTDLQFSNILQLYVLDFLPFMTRLSPQSQQKAVRSGERIRFNMQLPAVGTLREIFITLPTY